MGAIRGVNSAVSRRAHLRVAWEQTVGGIRLSIVRIRGMYVWYIWYDVWSVFIHQLAHSLSDSVNA
jgi:hypothetical protein